MFTTVFDTQIKTFCSCVLHLNIIYVSCWDCGCRYWNVTLKQTFQLNIIECGFGETQCSECRRLLCVSERLYWYHRFYNHVYDMTIKIAYLFLNCYRVQRDGLIFVCRIVITLFEANLSVAHIPHPLHGDFQFRLQLSIRSVQVRLLLAQ
jgi:hypothetical protein